MKRTFEIEYPEGMSPHTAEQLEGLIDVAVAYQVIPTVREIPSSPTPEQQAVLDAAKRFLAQAKSDSDNGHSFFESQNKLLKATEALEIAAQMELVESVMAEIIEEEKKEEEA